MYGGGKNVPFRGAAQRWFRVAAKLGHAHAQLMLGRYLAGGAAGKPRARLWVERVVAQGFPDAEADLASRRCQTIKLGWKSEPYRPEMIRRIVARAQPLTPT
jgi:TPR repeat protein